MSGNIPQLTLACRGLWEDGSDVRRRQASLCLIFMTPEDEISAMAHSQQADGSVTRFINHHYRHFNVTDTCIPEGEAMRRMETAMLEVWTAADQAGKRFFPHEFFYQVLLSGKYQEFYQIDPKDSWMLAAAEKNLPIIVPGWEDATLGNMYAAAVIRGDIKNVHTVRTGIEYMTWLAEFYTEASMKNSIGMFQIGGGIAGDFPICVVPMLHQDLGRDSVPLWGYFCQISDSTTSYGSYSGAVPNEKITWGKLGVDTPKFIIESDATIVAPLIFAHVLGW